MSKPSWDTAPEWANWLAMDEDGQWFWYELEPKQCGYDWRTDDGRFDKAELKSNWRGTLEQRP